VTTLGIVKPVIFRNPSLGHRVSGLDRSKPLSLAICLTALFSCQIIQARPRKELYSSCARWPACMQWLAGLPTLLCSVGDRVGLGGVGEREALGSGPIAWATRTGQMPAEWLAAFGCGNEPTMAHRRSN
jgi:hypothetical protein